MEWMGFELKGLIAILLIISILLNFFTYKEVSTKSGFIPNNRFWILLIISCCLFIYALYLNDIEPIILF